MTPSADPASQQMEVTAHLVPADLLGGGEIIVLALKPSGWFVVITSLPVLVCSAIVAAVVAGFYHGRTHQQAIMAFCAVVAIGRVLAACWQWLGRTYVLTNRRIVTVRGLVNIHVASADLSNVSRAVLTTPLADRAVGTGDIYCLTDSRHVPPVTWNTIAKPAEVHEIVLDAINRARPADQGLPEGAGREE